MKEKVKFLIIQYLSGEASKQEEKELISWISESSANKGSFEEIKRAFELSNEAFETYEPDIKTAWDKLHDQIQKKTGARNILGMYNKKTWWTIAASIALFIGITYFLNKQVKETPQYIAEDKSAPKEWITVKSQNDILKFNLPDSSYIYLNKNTTLTYIKNFEGDERLATLNGEAFFEVKNNSEKPFIITAHNTQIKVLGTSFNVKAHEKDEEVEIAVKEGEVEFSVKERDYETKEIVKKGEKATYHKKNKTMKRGKNTNGNMKWWLKKAGKDIKYFFKQLDKKLKKK